ncbi:MAG: glycosyltransferase family A protein [Desulfomonilia bacterium]|nr:glycosyltransferase family A protein [Desulfomonilia bacterium]
MKVHSHLYSCAEKTGLKRVTDRHGLSRNLNNLAIGILDAFQDMRFFWFQRRFDRAEASRNVSAAILTVDPSSSLQRCMDSVNKQTLKPTKIDIIRNIKPFSKASQEALKHIETPYYVQVDDDMILAPTCFERLYFMMRDDSTCAQAVADLDDPFFGHITGVKMYRTAPVRAIGFHPFQGEKGCERFMTRELSSMGFTTNRTRSIQGVHHPSYTPQEIFWKFKFIGEQLRYYEEHPRSLPEYMDLLMDRWRRHHDNLTLFGLCGLFSGIQSTSPSKELDYSDRVDSRLFQKVQEVIDSVTRSRAPLK